MFGDIEDMDNTVCIFEVGRDKTTVPFLSCSIPHLQSIILSVSVEVFDIEVDADCVLDGQVGT